MHRLFLPHDVRVTHLDDPCILFAMRRESAPFCRAFRPHRSFPGAPCWARFCGPPGRAVLVAETGMGQANVGRALDWLLAEPRFEDIPYRPRMIVFAGFAGALRDTLHVGDVVVASEVIDERGQIIPTTWPKMSSQGRLLTMDRMIGAPEEKRRLGEQFQADAVDMESAFFAERCTQASIPFGCVRAISDDMATSLSPGLASLLSGGVVSPWRIAHALAARPFMVHELLRLGRDTSHAAEQLRRCLLDQPIFISPSG